ncbi:type II toxin-antitoxin system VapB family antitoxin [Candidatus Halobeggiatoa sp. HSG11]|nr:type II toxin-antitoxin system VapB family antitoxin [Candidatus Halobeggiatoa sp. HSG11]
MQDGYMSVLLFLTNLKNMELQKLELPEELLKKAMEISQIKTKSKMITVALQEFIRQAEISDLKKYKGKIDLDINLDIIRDRN